MASGLLPFKTLGSRATNWSSWRRAAASTGSQGSVLVSVPVLRSTANGREVVAPRGPFLFRICFTLAIETVSVIFSLFTSPSARKALRGLPQGARHARRQPPNQLSGGLRRRFVETDRAASAFLERKVRPGARSNQASGQHAQIGLMADEQDSPPVGMLPEEGELFRRFIQKEVEILNLLAVLRLKKAKFGTDSIRNFIIPSGNGAKDAMMMELASTEDLDNISRLLQKTEYKSIVSKGIDEFRKSGSLIMLEIELYKHLLKQSMLFMHQHPLSVDVILGYMFAKDVEIRNLRIIIKGKQLGLGEQFIESQLVY